MQPQSPPPPTWPQPYYMPPPKKPGFALLALVIIVVLAFVVIAIIGFSFRDFFGKRQPNMTVTNIQFEDDRECLLGVWTGGSVMYTLDLVNTGGAGFANLAFKLDGITKATDNFYVGENSMNHIRQLISVGDCDAHEGSIEILSQWAG